MRKRKKLGGAAAGQDAYGRRDACRYLLGRKNPNNPSTQATAPEIRNQVVLLVGDPVKKRDTCELNESLALRP